MSCSGFGTPPFGTWLTTTRFHAELRLGACRNDCNAELERVFSARNVCHTPCIALGAFTPENSTITTTTDAGCTTSHQWDCGRLESFASGAASVVPRLVAAIVYDIFLCILHRRVFGTACRDDALPWGNGAVFTTGGNRQQRFLLFMGMLWTINSPRSDRGIPVDWTGGHLCYFLGRIKACPETQHYQCIACADSICHELHWYSVADCCTVPCDRLDFSRAACSGAVGCSSVDNTFAPVGTPLVETDKAFGSGDEKDGWRDNIAAREWRRRRWSRRTWWRDDYVYSQFDSFRRCCHGEAAAFPFHRSRRILCLDGNLVCADDRLHVYHGLDTCRGKHDDFVDLYWLQPISTSSYVVSVSFGGIIHHDCLQCHDYDGLAPLSRCHCCPGFACLAIAVCICQYVAANCSPLHRITSYGTHEKLGRTTRRSWPLLLVQYPRIGGRNSLVVPCILLSSKLVSQLSLQSGHLVCVGHHSHSCLLYVPTYLCCFKKF